MLIANRAERSDSSGSTQRSTKSKMLGNFGSNESILGYLTVKGMKFQRHRKILQDSIADLYFNAFQKPNRSALNLQKFSEERKKETRDEETWLN